jgi:glutamine amidotransferase
MIVIVDYGMGNLRSVAKALESLGATARVSSEAADAAQADKLIVPGVGAFGAAMRELGARGLIEPIRQFIASGRPYLGICLGLQLLFESSEEGEGAGSPAPNGFGVLRGAVRQFPASPVGSAGGRIGLKIPHMGWNCVESPHTANDMPRTAPPVPSGSGRLDPGVQPATRAASPASRCPVLAGVPEGSFVYFVHSFYAEPADRSIIALETDYGVRFASMIWRGSLYATQFHPEKSQAVGLRLLDNFLALS